MIIRELNNVGKVLYLCGSATDPYFNNVTVGDPADDFFVRVVGQYISPSDVIFDVGANVGLTAVMLAQAAPKGQVFAFEPGEETFVFLEATIAANGLTNCHAQKIALGAVEGRASFHSNNDSESASHLAPEGVALGGANAVVDVKTVDQVIGENNLGSCDFLKIDVEGFELDVLAGAKVTLERFRTKAFVEFNMFTIMAFRNQNPRATLEQLRFIFPFLYNFRHGEICQLKDDADMLGLIHELLTSPGALDDLLCAFEPLFP